jgi:hypothetical protein
MTPDDPTPPHDLTPLDNPVLRDPLMIEMKDTHKDVKTLHPLLDLLATPLDAGESDLIEKLFGLLTEATEELRLNRETRATQQEKTAALRADVAALEELVTRQADMVAEMHALLTGPLPAP